jgi:hypothetical protein
MRRDGSSDRRGGAPEIIPDCHTGESFTLKFAQAEAPASHTFRQ